MKEYLKQFSLVVLGVFLFVTLEHFMIFRSYGTLQETCKVILGSAP